MNFADILLPLKISQAYTYAVPLNFQVDIQVGKRVLVSFGKNKFYAGIVVKLHDNPPQSPNTKEIEHILDAEPILTSIQLDFWQWLADYYMCELGEVMDNALPNYFKLSSERFFKINENLDLSLIELGEDEVILYDALRSSGQISLKEIKDTWGNKKGIFALNQLLDIGAIEPVDIVKDKYKPKYEKIIKIQDKYQHSQELNQLFDSLQKKSPVQWKTLISYFNITQQQKSVIKSELIEHSQSSSTVIKSMIEKGIFTEYLVQIDRFDIKNNGLIRQPVLSDKQVVIYNDIKNQFKSKNVLLLRGITGSGKTEIYIKSIQDKLAEEKTCLLILPEIALTQQIVSRLSEFFGNQFLVYHSMISQNKRYEIWNKVLRGDIKFVVGTRSAIFLPFQSLDLVIIDEEHDPSLKQTDNHPKFSARDALIHYSASFGTKIILGSATPSMDSYFNVIQGKYGYVELLERYGEAVPPSVFLINLRDREVADNMKSYYSKTLMDEVEHTVKRGEQVILFQNRRGYAPYIQCNTCGFIQKCDHCDVRLTYHTSQKVLICHYCNKKYKLHTTCIQCKSPQLKTRGLGTQKVEEEIQLFMPQLRVARLDIDVASSASRIDQILEDFKKKEYDVLIGTQMVSKGLDFENLTLVGVVQGDAFFSFIDYKTDERAFQILSQVSGRVGRGKIPGKVFIQSNDIENKVIQYVLNQDWKGFVDKELENRKQFVYPPFCKLIKVSIKHLKEDLVAIYADKIAKRIQEDIKSIVLGPTVPPISRIRNQYIREILIKLPKNKDLQTNKKAIKSIIDSEKMTLENKNFVIDILVDV